jgi:hypothetical protein
VFYECKSFKMHLDADQTLPRFSRFFLEFILIFVDLILFIRRL